MKRPHTIKYYSLEKILSYNRIWNFILGMRTGGKSFAAKKHCITQFLKKGKQFIYVRRRDIDIKLTAPTYFDDIAGMFPEHVFAYKGNEFYIDGQLAGYAIALSMILKYKSVPFPLVTTIVFDEFLPEDRSYLGGKDNPFFEPELCTNFYNTVARLREDVRFLFISNTVTLVNPYFTYFNVDKLLKPNTRFIRSKAWVLEIVDVQEIKEIVNNSQFGDLIRNSRYASYAYENQFYLDNNTFIEDVPVHCFYQCTIIYNGQKYGLYEDKHMGIYYVTEKFNQFCRVIYSLDSNSHNTNSILISRNGKVYKGLKEAFETGNVRFSSQRAKMCVITFLNYQI